MNPGSVIITDTPNTKKPESGSPQYNVQTTTTCLIGQHRSHDNTKYHNTFLGDMLIGDMAYHTSTYHNEYLQLYKDPTSTLCISPFCT